MSEAQDREMKLAEELGFEGKPDWRRGANWCKFQKGDVHVWIGRHWIRARLIDDRFRHHTKHGTLEEALKGENGKSFGPDSRSDEEMKAAYEVAKEDTTCESCPLNGECEFAWDPYNTDGDCLADK